MAKKTVKRNVKQAKAKKVVSTKATPLRLFLRANGSHYDSLDLMVGKDKEHLRTVEGCLCCSGDIIKTFPSMGTAGVGAVWEITCSEVLPGVSLAAIKDPTILVAQKGGLEILTKALKSWVETIEDGGDRVGDGN